MRPFPYPKSIWATGACLTLANRLKDRRTGSIKITERSLEGAPVSPSGQHVSFQVSAPPNSDVQHRVIFGSWTQVCGLAADSPDGMSFAIEKLEQCVLLYKSDSADVRCERQSN